MGIVQIRDTAKKDMDFTRRNFALLRRNIAEMLRLYDALSEGQTTVVPKYLVPSLEKERKTLRNRLEKEVCDSCRKAYDSPDCYECDIPNLLGHT